MDPRQYRFSSGEPVIAPESDKWEDRYGFWWAEENERLRFCAGVLPAWYETIASWDQVEKANGPLWPVPEED